MKGTMEMSEGTRRVVGVSPPPMSDSARPGMNIQFHPSLTLTHRRATISCKHQGMVGLGWMEVETF